MDDVSLAIDLGYKVTFVFTIITTALCSLTGILWMGVKRLKSIPQIQETMERIAKGQEGLTAEVYKINETLGLNITHVGRIDQEVTFLKQELVQIKHLQDGGRA